MPFWTASTTLGWQWPRLAHHKPAELRDLGMPEATVETVLSGLQIDVRAHDWDAALAAGFLRPATRAGGLSLGDRACLALALALGVPAVTADRSWSSVAEAVGVEVAAIR